MSIFTNKIIYTECIMEYFNQYIFIKTKNETNKPRTALHSFQYFIQNSRIELISDSSAFGIVFKCMFQKKENKSPYFYINSQGELSNVKTIAIKLLLLCDYNYTINNDEPEQNTRLSWDYIDKTNKKGIKLYEKRDAFMNEIQMLLDVSEKGIYALNRNTPISLYSRIYSHTSAQYKLLEYILHRNCADKISRNSISQITSTFRNVQQKYNTNIYFGLAAMEYIESDYIVYCDIIKPIIFDEIKVIPGNENIHKYDSVNLSKYSKRLRWMYNTTRYELLRLAIDTGYSQGDYHTENLLVNEKKRLTMIIDFGKGKEIIDNRDNIDLWMKIKKSNSDEESLQYLRDILLNIFETTFVENEKNSAEYKWLKNIDMEDYRIILFIHQLRELYTEKKTTKVFDMYFESRSEYVFNGYIYIDDKPFTQVEKYRYYFCKIPMRMLMRLV